jgi:hypothetical protein
LFIKKKKTSETCIAIDGGEKKCKKVSVDRSINSNYCSSHFKKHFDKLHKEYKQLRLVKIDEIIEKIEEGKFNVDDKSELFDSLFNTIMSYIDESTYIIEKWIKYGNVYSRQLYDKINKYGDSDDDIELFEESLIFYKVYEKANTLPLHFNDYTEGRILRNLLDSQNEDENEDENEKEFIKLIIHKKKLDLCKLEFKKQDFRDHGFDKNEITDLFQYSKEMKKEKEEKKNELGKISVRRDNKGRFVYGCNNETYVFDRETAAIYGKIDKNDEIVELSDEDRTALKKLKLKMK